MKTPSSHRAFTLIEILVAVALIGIIISAVCGSMAAATRSVDAYRDRGQAITRSQIGLQQIAGAIRCCSEGLSTQGGQVRWVTTEALFEEATGEQGLFDVALRWDRSSAQLLASQRLWRPGTPAYPRVGPWQVLVDHVRDVQWSFFDGTSWRQDWEGDVNKPLPRVVKIDMTTQDDHHRVYEFQALASPCRTPRASVGVSEGESLVKP